MPRATIVFYQVTPSHSFRKLKKKSLCCAKRQAMHWNEAYQNIPIWGRKQQKDSSKLSSLPVCQCLHFSMLFFVCGFISLNKGQVGFGSHMRRTSVSLKVIRTLLCHSILEWAHTLHNFPLCISSAVHIKWGQKMFRYLGKKEKHKSK